MPLAVLHTVAPDRAVDRSVDLAVHRLAEELGRQPQAVRPVVQECRRQLSGAPAGALPELVERLARHRLRAPVD
ncbi:hypothetical protein GCM10023328_46100 [Modestobacter marinus]|uniref:Uncharacterized protein n=1 Tax=Modestobacter marinus TaxID=477641 RepID=A0A846M289_9ACTN|nr:hypothetical protein [Modestobacter marinus]NIH69759.1 hypothetical protein [Modestobacter marinus]GGL65102.1 hypothetical protein GCM10011589_21530 [Modestobacter marinus]